MKISNLLKIALFLISISSAYADIITINNGASPNVIKIEGDNGELSNSLHNFLGFIEFDPSFEPYEKNMIKAAYYKSKKWTKCEDCMDGDAYIFEINVAKTATKFSFNNNTLNIQGEFALLLIRGMWLMQMDYPDNFEVVRSNTHGEIRIIDLFSRQIICEKKYLQEAGSHLSHMEASCSLSGLKKKN